MLHIGMGKTGTSAIQSFLAINHEKLKGFGVDYPYHKSFTKAKDGLITSGNPESFYEFEESEFDTVLFSGERFFRELTAGSQLYEKLINTGREVTILCFTRDIFEHFTSSYNQSIKRRGSIFSPKGFIVEHSVFKVLDTLLDFIPSTNFKFVLRNYSHHKNDLIKMFMQIVMGEQADAFLEVAEYIDAPVNRSLSESELEIQRLFNKHANFPTSKYISDAFVNSLPNIPSADIYLSRDVCEALLEKNINFIEHINKWLPEDEKMDTSIPSELPAPSQKLTYEFTNDQLDVLVSNVCSILNTCTQFTNNEVNVLYRIAMKSEKNRPISKDDALLLMKFALRLRPDWEHFQEKVDEWKDPQKN